MSLQSFFASQEWDVAATVNTEPRSSGLFNTEQMPLASASRRLLAGPPTKGHIYRHQKAAIEQCLQGDHVCMSTGTASGKSLAFQVAAIEKLAVDPEARVIAIYPMKALGREQEDRWRRALATAGLDAEVGRIDGSVKGKKHRLDILERSSVVIMTPDIIHAWLLFQLQEGAVRRFLRKIVLIIVDEVHTYGGVFGSNAAFLFRRLRHVLDILGAHPQFFGASATIANPQEHLSKLIGLPFTLVSEELDSSPRQPLEITLVTPPRNSSFMTEVTKLLAHLQEEGNSRFIAFVDSRIQVEHITNILARKAVKEQDDDEVPEEAELLQRLDVLPYRAGYEQPDRDRIQKRLNQGALSGVVSTSALELGIDIKDLDTCVLVGVPYSATSLHQRIGRIGRHAPGQVIVINGGTIYDQAVFAEPQRLLQRPLAESAMYLENRYIQYIHALCLARLQGEHDKTVTNLRTQENGEFSSTVLWPEGFLSLCQQERLGEITAELQSWKAEAGESPNHTFPLRDIESQFTIERGSHATPDRLGSLSFGQLMREAYPGAIYYHLTRPYRVLQVLRLEKRVRVRPGRYYSTRPNRYSRVFPNLSSGNVHSASKRGALLAIECNVQIQELVTGFRERRGPNENSYTYPLKDHDGVNFDQSAFNRHFFTTGVILTHPVLSRDQVQITALAELVYEAFLLLYPFERQDIHFASDQHQADRPPFIERGNRFIAVYDQTYGSLRLTQRLVEDGVVRDVLRAARRLAGEQELFSLNATTLAVLDRLVAAAESEAEALIFQDGMLEVEDESEEYQRIIMPGSKGLNLLRNNEEFLVQEIRPGPRGLRYLGVPSVYENTTAQVYADIDHIAEIPGISRIGIYRYDSGEIVEWDGRTTIASLAATPAAPTAPAAPEPADGDGQRETHAIDCEAVSARLERVLVRFFDEAMLRQLSASIAVDYDNLPGDSRQEKSRLLIWYARQGRRLLQLVNSARSLYEKRTPATD